MKSTWPALVLVAAVVCVAGVLVTTGETQSLSGTLRNELIKPETKFYLELDGMTGGIGVTGDALKNFKAGDRVFVKGVIRTRLHNPRPDGLPQQQPIHWVIFMEVRQAKLISLPFGLKDR